MPLRLTVYVYIQIIVLGSSLGCSMRLRLLREVLFDCLALFFPWACKRNDFLKEEQLCGWVHLFEMHSFCRSCKAACAVATPVDGEWVPTSCCTTQGGASPWPGMSGSPGFPPDERGKRKSEAMNWWDFLKGVEKGSLSCRWSPPLCFGPMWPILHWMSCFTTCIFGNSAQTGATAVVESVLAIREVFKKGLCLPQLLRCTCWLLQFRWLS